MSLPDAGRRLTTHLSSQTRADDCPFLSVRMTSTTNWFDLPFDLKSNILLRIGVFDILENAQKVCTDWRTTCINPAMWTVINMSRGLSSKCKHRKMCKIAVDRSQGQLVDLSISDFGNDELLLYVADRSSQLRRLTILCGYHDYIESLTEALKKFPLLVELKLHTTEISHEVIESVGRYCPMLKTLDLNQDFIYLNDEIAMAIGENLHELRHLKFSGNMTNIGLQVIMDGCCHLKSLDLSRSFNVDLKGDVVKRCSEKIKCLKLPDPFKLKPMFFSYSDDDSYGCSDSDDEY